MEPIKVACTRKELSCIIANLLAEVRPVCDVCESLQDGELVIGGSVAGTDDHAYIKVTDYGFEYYGDADVLARVREARCLYGTLDTPKENGGAAQQGSLPNPQRLSQG